MILVLHFLPLFTSSPRKVCEHPSTSVPLLSRPLYSWVLHACMHACARVHACALARMHGTACMLYLQIWLCLEVLACERQSVHAQAKHHTLTHTQNRDSRHGFVSLLGSRPTPRALHLQAHSSMVADALLHRIMCSTYADNAIFLHNAALDCARAHVCVAAWADEHLTFLTPLGALRSTRMLA